MKHGILLLDKPEGMTSHDVVKIVRKKLQISSVGHAGTLDPLATGLLILLLGEATKISDYVMSDEKTYVVEAQMGLVTDSGDITGQPLARIEQMPALDKAILESQNLKGQLMLPVPLVSAVKIKGKKLYEYAREGADVVVPQRMMEVFDVTDVSAQTIDAPAGADGAIIPVVVVRATVRCAKGVYIRSWVEKLGEILGCGATVKTLRRLRSGSFDVEKSININDLERFPKGFISISDVLQTLPQIKVKGRDENLITNGQIPNGIQHYLGRVGIDKDTVILSEEGVPLALLKHEPTVGFKIGRVFRVS